ncbi:MAG: hypothetical protein IPK75_18385 [Acidobacteria bacterium]|nr:hypothetical protein [Acidobacteriota bacterium]
MFQRLLEVGRKISKKNRERLHSAMEKLRELIDEATEHDADATEAERSASDKEKLLRAAIQAKFKRPGAEYFYCYIADTFDTFCVFSCDDGLFAIDYALSDDGAVALGDSRPVIARTVYDDAPVSEAAETPLLGDCVPLVEASATAELSEAATANLKLISPGWGSSGYYSPALLKAAAAKFAKGLKMYWNHQTAAEESARPEGNLDHLAGELLEDAAWNESGPTGPGLYAKAKVFERFAPAVKDLAQHIGVSIRAVGTAKPGEAEGRKGPVIETIAGVKSVDYVTVPGRGGEILSLFEAAGRRPATEPPTNEEHEMNEAQVKALLEAELTPLRAENAACKAEAARLRETLALRDARDFARTKLAKIDLPEATRQRLAEALPAHATLKDGKLDEAAFTAVIEEAVKAEGEYLKSVGIGTGRINGMGSPAQESKTVKTEDITAAFVALGMSESAAKIAAEGRAA